MNEKGCPAKTWVRLHFPDAYASLAVNSGARKWEIVNERLDRHYITRERITKIPRSTEYRAWKQAVKDLKAYTEQLENEKNQ